MTTEILHAKREVCKSLLCPPLCRLWSVRTICSESPHRFFEFYAPIPATVPSKGWVCHRSLAEIAASNHTGGTAFCHECFVWSSRGLCDGSIPHSEESYRARARVCVCVTECDQVQQYHSAPTISK